MRKEILEFVKNMSAETTLDEMQAVCRTTEELDYILEHCKGFEGNVEVEELPLSLRLRAKLSFQNVPTEEITTGLYRNN